MENRIDRITDKIKKRTKHNQTCNTTCIDIEF